MATGLSRRGFLRGSALMAGAVAGSSVVPLTSSASMPLLYGPAPGVAKLNSNENPYGPSRKALAAMVNASSKGAYYVGDSVEMLISMIGERFGVTRDWITLSSGSSGALTYLAVAKAKEGKIVGPDLFWDTTTKKAIDQVGAGGLVRTPRTADLSIDLDLLEQAIAPGVSMVQVCNPNNPTGMVVPASELRAFCKRVSKKVTVLVDEAYNEITDNPEDNSMIDLVREGYDVIIARTFSKIYGLAGMRVGYMIANPETTALVQRHGLGNYALNQAGVAAAVASFNDFEFLDYSKKKIIEAREMIADAVARNELSAAPSETSFMFVDLGDLNAETFRKEMERRNVLIRGIYGDYTNFSRVSMGLIEDVEKYVGALPAALEATMKT